MLALYKQKSIILPRYSLYRSRYKRGNTLTRKGYSSDLQAKKQTYEDGLILISETEKQEVPEMWQELPRLSR